MIFAMHHLLTINYLKSDGSYVRKSLQIPWGLSENVIADRIDEAFKGVWDYDLCPFDCADAINKTIFDLTKLTVLNYMFEVSSEDGGEFLIVQVAHCHNHTDFSAN
jgi:hypothetical protein